MILNNLEKTSFDLIPKLEEKANLLAETLVFKLVKEG